MVKVEAFLVSVTVLVFLFGAMAGASFRIIAEIHPPERHIMAARVVQMSLKELSQEDI